MTDPATAAAPSGRGRSCCAVLARVAAAFIVVVAVLGIGGWVERVPLLRASARWWIVSDPIEPSDAAVVLGGGLDDRPFAAAEYYRRGLVKKVLVSNVGESPAARLGVIVSHVAANRAVLLRLGVPESAIGLFGSDLANTHQEAVALRQWAAREGVRSVIVPTEIFTTRRLRWVLHRVIGEEAVVRIAALDPPEYGQADWWQHEGGVIAFQNEVIKYLYYRLKY